MDEQYRRYKIMNQTTIGWTLIPDQAQKQTKEECDKMLDNVLKAGANPQYIKVVANNDPKYIDEKTGRSL